MKRSLGTALLLACGVWDSPADAQRTVDFYTRVVGLEYVAGLVPPETRSAPS